jgi:ribA/ribD-fused uncharacterized protein
MTIDMRDAITNFHAPGFEWLSNFHPCPHGIFLASPQGGVWEYATVEHAYQAAKFNSVAARQRIRLCVSAGAAKREAADLLNDPTSMAQPGWTHVRVQIMHGLLLQKFAGPGGAPLGRLLAATAPRMLVEGNTWHDHFWGMCEVEGKFAGQNMLGKLLMSIRTTHCHV